MVAGRIRRRAFYKYVQCIQDILRGITFKDYDAANDLLKKLALAFPFPKITINRSKIDGGFFIGSCFASIGGLMPGFHQQVKYGIVQDKEMRECLESFPMKDIDDTKGYPPVVLDNWESSLKDKKGIGKIQANFSEILNRTLCKKSDRRFRFTVEMVAPELHNKGGVDKNFVKQYPRLTLAIAAWVRKSANKSKYSNSWVLELSKVNWLEEVVKNGFNDAAVTCIFKHYNISEA